MKKIAVVLFAALFSLSALSFAQSPESQGKNKVTHNKVTQNKVTKDVGKGVHKAGKGVKHGAYDATHNKATKGVGVNKGNQKYKYKDDL